MLYGKICEERWSLIRSTENNFLVDPSMYRAKKARDLWKDWLENNWAYGAYRTTAKKRVELYNCYRNHKINDKQVVEEILKNRDYLYESYEEKEEHGKEEWDDEEYDERDGYYDDPWDYEEEDEDRGNHEVCYDEHEDIDF